MPGPFIPERKPKANSLIPDTLENKLSEMNTLPMKSEPKVFVSNTLGLLGGRGVYIGQTRYRKKKS